MCYFSHTVYHPLAYPLNALHFTSYIIPYCFSLLQAKPSPTQTKVCTHIHIHVHTCIQYMYIHNNIAHVHVHVLYT